MPEWPAEGPGTAARCSSGDSANAKPSTALLQPRWALSYLRGPMTQRELRRAVGEGTAEPKGRAQPKDKAEPKDKASRRTRRAEGQGEPKDKAEPTRTTPKLKSAERLVSVNVQPLESDEYARAVHVSASSLA